jgi:type I restriction enzyme S subunit
MSRWPKRPLGEVAKFINGRAFKPSEWSSDGVPIIRIQNLTDHNAPSNFFSGTYDERHLVKKGDLLVSWSATLDAFIWNRGSAVLNQHIFRVTPSPEVISTTYLFYALKSVMEDLRAQTHGATMKHITKGPFERTPIPVPPLAEQERIVALLDEADELRKLRAKADRRTADLIPALFHEMFGDPGTNSKGLAVKPLGELVSNQDGRRRPVKSSDRAIRQGKYPYYGASGIIDHVDDYLFDETSLLIGEDGANLLARATPIAFLAHGKYWVNNHAHVVTSNGKADLHYLCALLNLRDLSDYVTGSAQPKLNQANMNRVPIPVPPLPLQKEFAQRVTAIRAIEAEQSTSRQRLDNLFQSMLHRAFTG